MNERLLKITLFGMETPKSVSNLEYICKSSDLDDTIRYIQVMFKVSVTLSITDIFMQSVIIEGRLEDIVVLQ